MAGGKVYGGEVMKRFSPYELGDMYDDDNGSYVYYADHLEEMDRTLSIAGSLDRENRILQGRVAELEAEVANECRYRGNAEIAANQIASDYIEKINMLKEEITHLTTTLQPIREVYKAWDDLDEPQYPHSTVHKFNEQRGDEAWQAIKQAIEILERE